MFSTAKPATSKSTEDFEGPFKPAKTLKQGSVLDLLKAPGSKSITHYASVVFVLHGYSEQRLLTVLI